MSSVVFGGSVAGYSRQPLQDKYPGYGSDFVLFPDENEQPIIGYLKMDNTSRFLGLGSHNLDQDVKLEYFSRKYPEGVPIGSKEELASLVNNDKAVKFITHGWLSGGRKDSSILIRNAFLHKYDANVVVVDWTAISSNPFYPIPMMETPKVGLHLANYVNHIIQTGVDPKSIHMVGHSLGAHVTGFAGRAVQGEKIGRITGLDPALPGFNIGMVPEGTLSKEDAAFVDVIHTCAGFLGYWQPLGHADFYPNGGGPPQPGCNILEFIEACSHGLSWKIFASSLNKPEPYLAIKCLSLLDLEKKRCHSEEFSFIGDPTPSTSRGIYLSQVLQDELVTDVDQINKI